MTKTRLIRNDGKVWGVKAMLYMVHRVKADINLRPQAEPMVLTFSRIITVEEFMAVMSPEKFAELQCTIEYCGDRETGATS